MKRLLLLLPLFICTSCLWQQPVRNTDTPDMETYPFPTRVGSAASTTWFWLWETGDSSPERAQQNGGISQVSSITRSSDSFLGLVKRSTTVVRGN